MWTESPSTSAFLSSLCSLCAKREACGAVKNMGLRIRLYLELGVRVSISEGGRGGHNGKVERKLRKLQESLFNVHVGLLRYFRFRTGSLNRNEPPGPKTFAHGRWSRRVDLFFKKIKKKRMSLLVDDFSIEMKKIIAKYMVEIFDHCNFKNW